MKEDSPTLPGGNPHRPAAAQPASRRRIPPSLAERYEDFQVAGEGAMGTVYRAVDRRLGRTVALKLLKGDAPSLSARFISEARSQARIQHEHVCRVYEAGQADGEPYIVMQFIDGEPLSKVSSRLTLEQQVKLLWQVSLAVHEAHRLGMIHRDLKPGNILVEQLEDGTWKPYVVDFGLARQVEDHGQTQTGEVLGTPQYMSPEQANGDVHELDRRTDVYSLGATLYDVIAGRPPFVSEHPWKLLVMMAMEDPPPLRTVKPGVPREVETIVMKCLERERERRYDSARALAEELQRVLDGEPIQAKRASWGYVLWKKAHKHKLLTALLTVVVLAVLGQVGAWVGAQRHAAEQARLGRELGESVKETELFLRAAYGLPLHDVERERDVVRARLGEIQQRMSAAGKAGQGPGHYALGVGQLALGDPEQARVHLEQALAAGYSPADLDYALGRALGELLRRALEDSRRITSQEEREKQLARIDREIREPALTHLRAAVGVRLEVPEYAEGLIALYEGKHEQAIEKARTAFARAPWMYEPKKLEGDALYAEGSRYRHDAAFDYEKMKGYFDRAAQAYREAAEMGSSDPEVHRAECELWEKMGWAASAQGLPTGPPFEAARAACDRAVRASSRDGRALVQRALVLLASVHVQGSSVSQDTLPVVEEALRAAEDGVRARPRDVMAHYAAALALSLRTRQLYALGREASMQHAIEGYQRVLSLDPNFTWAVNELGDVYLAEARKRLSEGDEVAPLLESAVRQYERAMALDPSFSLPVGGRLDALAMRLESELARGRDGHPALEALSSAVSQFEQSRSSPWLIVFWKARAQRMRGLREFSHGRDPRGPLGVAIELLRSAEAQSPKNSWLRRELASCHLLQAEHARGAGQDAAPALEQAWAAIRETITPDKPISPSLSLLLARIEAGRVAWVAKPVRGAELELSRGLARVETTLARSPNHPEALLARGLLLLAQARMDREHRARSEHALRAKESLAAALQRNPLMASELASPLSAAEQLIR